jgi:dienelactone hydrolase
LQLACSGADVKAVVSFHGGLFKPTAEEAKAIKGKVLICNGGADTFIAPDDRKGLLEAFEAAKVDYVFVDYSGAEHAFTNPDAGKFGLKGISYNEKADKRSWRLMKDCFGEAFGGRDLRD